MAHTKEYINLKISNCQRLVDEAISEDQKKAYQGYLDFWTEKLPKKEQPEVIAKKEEIKAKKEIEKEAKAFELKKQAEAKAEAEAEELAIEEAKAKKVADLKAKLKELEPEPEEELLIEIPNHEEPEEPNEIDIKEIINSEPE